jgi:hypothetical protein
VTFLREPFCDARADAARGTCDQYSMFHMHILPNAERMRNALMNEKERV